MSAALENEIRTWPRGLAEIARLIGPRLAMQLGEAVGGVETYIPKNVTPTHPLARLVGVDALAILAREFGGQTLVIPRGVHCKLKKAAILAATGSRRSVALALGCSARYVRKVTNEAKPDAAGTPRRDNGQPDLFGTLATRR